MGLVEEIWKDKEKEELNPLAFSEVAKDWAEKIAGDGKNLNKRSQLMKYYDTIVKLNERAKNTEDFNIILVQLNRELALIHYARGRGKVSDTFVEMMEELIKSVNSKNDLKVITDFLECFIAFYTEKRKD